MATFIMLTRLSHEGLKSPGALADLSHEVMDHIRKNCPSVAWKASYVVLGPADYVDIFTAPDIETATKVATIIRTFGHATNGGLGGDRMGEVHRPPPRPAAAAGHFVSGHPGRIGVTVRGG